MSADLNDFDTRTVANAGAEIELTSLRTGKPAGAFITILGTDSDRYREIQNRRNREILDRVTAKGKGTGAATEYTPEEIDEMSIALLAECTLGWRELSGPEWLNTFSLDNAKRLYREYPAIREQINQAMAERANFLLPSKQG